MYNELIWTINGPYRRAGYADEADLEAAIIEVQRDLFGANRIYLDVKKKIGTKGVMQNIPDGYLIDLNGKQPHLFVVENELNAHDPLRHIAIQILQFSLSFESNPRAVKTVLFDSLQAQPDAMKQCEAYASTHGIRNLDHLLECLVFEREFAALVIIDQMPDDLENILMKKFRFAVEVLELSRYRNGKGEHIYHFEPFLADLIVDVTDRNDSAAQNVDFGEYDTLVVPALEEGFKEAFLGENRWYPLIISGIMRPQIKYIAGYQVSPIMAITHIAPVKSIEPWKDSGKYVVNFSEPAQPIGPIPLVHKGRVKALRSPRYASRQRLLAAKNLDDVW
jgi:hypothetical protein